MSADQRLQPITPAHFTTRQNCFDNDFRSSDSATVIASAALGLVANFHPSEGACYRCAFFLRLFLKEHFDVDGEAVVGFVNDGTNKLYYSHAWFEYKGRKTDLAISRPLTHSAPTGPLTIHGVDFLPGHSWTYHRHRTAEGERLEKMMRNSGHYLVPIMGAKDLEHAAMVERSKDDDLIRSFLNQAPEFSYDYVASVVKNGMNLKSKP